MLLWWFLRDIFKLLFWRHTTTCGIFWQRLKPVTSAWIIIFVLYCLAVKARANMGGRRPQTIRLTGFTAVLTMCTTAPKVLHLCWTRYLISWALNADSKVCYLRFFMGWFTKSHIKRIILKLILLIFFDDRRNVIFYIYTKSPMTMTT